MSDSNDSPPVETGPPAVKRRPSRRWLWLPAAVALLLVGWFSWRVPQYRLVGSYWTSDVLLIPAESGFLTRMPSILSCCATGGTGISAGKLPPRFRVLAPGQCA